MNTLNITTSCTIQNYVFYVYFLWILHRIHRIGCSQWFLLVIVSLMRFSCSFSVCLRLYMFLTILTPKCVRSQSCYCTTYEAISWVFREFLFKTYGNLGKVKIGSLALIQPTFNIFHLVITLEISLHSGGWTVLCRSIKQHIKDKIF